jgi:hypothetical protein
MISTETSVLSMGRYDVNDTSEPPMPTNSMIHAVTQGEPLDLGITRLYTDNGKYIKVELDKLEFSELDNFINPTYVDVYWSKQHAEIAVGLYTHVRIDWEQDTAVVIEGIYPALPCCRKDLQYIVTQRSLQEYAQDLQATNSTWQPRLTLPFLWDVEKLLALRRMIKSADR